MSQEQFPSSSRRDFITALSGVAVTSLMTTSAFAENPAVNPTSAAVSTNSPPVKLTTEQVAATVPLALKGNIKHSLVNWCYAPYFANFDDYAQFAKRIGCESLELCPPEHWPTLKKHGLDCAIAGSHGFPKGFNNPGEWEECTAALKKSIDACKEHGVERVITFTGMANGLSKEEGADNFVKGIQDAVRYAEQHNVTICLEMLNTRDTTHRMKGHPGYQGDKTEYCIELIKRVGSQHLKLLFDIYHVQIMDGDVIRRIGQHIDHIGHIHTAGNPGRGELDDHQEIAYPAIMKALVDVGYKGYVGHEFIPTREVATGLIEAVKVCDV
jgi:hydroxypyruvate isomerase